MCGIAGFYNLDGAPADPAVLQAMVDVQRHRGPDDQGTVLFSLRRTATEAAPTTRSEGALGFNRLAILDPSHHGHQPMADPDGVLWIAYNGEVYNAFEYRDELVADGVCFQSRTDTEILLHLYLKYGFRGMLDRLNGMFAVVIVDQRRREIMMARDPVGIKPFYWAKVGQTVLFASEIKSFLRHPDFTAELDREHLGEYLTFRYCAGERALFRHVRQLRPGFLLRVSPQGLLQERFAEIPDVDDAGDVEDPTDRFAEAFRAAVGSQLLSDVPVGCQLSGGIDSSLVCMLAREAAGVPMHAFSIVFDQPDFCEAEWIRTAVHASGAIPHPVPFRAAHFLTQFERATWHMDVPVNHPGALAIMRMAARARETVTVLLSGEGADELLGGYPRFRFMAVRHRLRPILPFLETMPWLGPKITGMYGTMRNDPAEEFVRMTQALPDAHVARLAPDLNGPDPVALRRTCFAEGAGSLLKNCLKYALQTYVVDLLVRQDKMTMAHSVENRVPFLDRDLIALVRGFPDRALVSDALILPGGAMRGTKITAKRLAERHFPDRFVYRNKSGLPIPLKDFFSHPPCVERMHEDWLPSMRRRGWLDPDVVAESWRRLPHTHDLPKNAVWIPVALELWAQQFIDGRGCG